MLAIVEFGNVLIEVAVGHAVDLEQVQVMTAPAHRRLQDVMHLPERERVRNLNSPPDRRLDPPQRDCEPNQPVSNGHSCNTTSRELLRNGCVNPPSRPAWCRSLG